MASRIKYKPAREDALRGSWPQGKEYELRFTVGEALALLQPLAWWLQQSGEQEAGRAELLGALAGSVPVAEGGRGASNAGALLTAICEQSGLLVDLGQKRYGFLHLRFQEYLAARHVQDRGFAEPRYFAEVAARFGMQGWREALLLAVGLRNPSLVRFMMAEVGGHAGTTWARGRDFNLPRCAAARGGCRLC